MSKVRGVRFSNGEEQLIEEFLEKNPLIDFSTLAKISILTFIRRPQINLNPITSIIKKDKRNVSTNN
mgnify:CR=1 FL=1